MAGSGVNFEGAEHLQAVLRKMLDDTEDLRPAWPIYHEAFKQAEADYFASEGEGKWRALSNRYAAWKRRHGYSDRILEMTGGLRTSLTQDGARHVFEPTARYTRMGTRNPVANLHFTKKGRGRRRPMDVRSAAMQAHMRQAVSEHADRYAETWGARA